MADNEILSELAEIKRHLSVLATVALRPALAKFEKEMLQSEKRVAMFRAFDGKRSPKEVGEIAGVTGRAVRDLIKDLREKGYLHVPASGSQTASVQYASVLDWYYTSSQ